MTDTKRYKEFPFQESYEDFAGITHNFIIQESEIIVSGYLIIAKELDKEFGYEFSAYSPVDPYEALGRIRQRIRKGLSTNYIKNSKHGFLLTHHKAEGQITHKGLVINGELISYEQMSIMLTSYEGFNIEFKIKEPEA